MATKVKSIWCCTECGHNQSKWAGQCPTCSKWNTLAEEVDVNAGKKRFESQSVQHAKPVRLKDVAHIQTPRIKTGVNEFDKLVGGGLVAGALMLVGGDPGIGKSTLLLQLSRALSNQGLTVLYICGEESIEQTCLRAERLSIDADNLMLLNETNFSRIKAHIDVIRPDVMIVDSIQMIYKDDIPSAPGSVSQVREAANEFMHLSKSQNIITFLIGHVTKSGEIAGPRILEHMVDTVLYFEGDKQHNFRMIRVVKNRFGPTDEIAVFQMQAKGLAEVSNPSQIFLEERMSDVIGSVVIPTIEGSRAILIETQSLVSKTFYTTPARKCTGLDPNRLALLLAVLEKRLEYPLYQQDVFVSVAGGVRVTEPGIDLGVLIAIASSFRNLKVDPATVIIGEVGLSGEVRSVTRVESRLKEAINMGFKRCIMPKRNVKGIPKEIRDQITIEGVRLVEEAVHATLGASE